jgi:hypothetical protein
MTDRIALAVIAGCIAVASLAVAGCGGGSSSSTTGASGASGASGSAPLSQDEFVSQANAICKANNAKIEALKGAPIGATPAQSAPYLTELAAINKAAAAQFEALTPPSDLQSDFNKMIAAINSKQAGVEKMLAAAKANDAGQLKAAFEQLQAPASQSSDLASSLGLTECTVVPQPQG